MALQRWSFKKRGDAATGNPTLATSYVNTFMSQYNTAIPFDGRRRIAYFFDQATVMENGGDADSVLIGSYEASTQTFYPISTLGVPAGASLISFRKGRLNIQALLFPALPTPLFANTVITGSIVSSLPNAAAVEALFGFPTGTVTQYSQVFPTMITYNINANYAISASLFDGDSTIQTINDVDGFVIGIGYRSFFGTSSLTSASFKNATTCDNSAFEGAVLLQSVNLDGVQILWDYVFAGCESMPSYSLPNCNRLGNMCFSMNTNLTSVFLPHVNQLADNVFDNCPHLPIISLPSLAICPKYAFGGWGGPGYTLEVPTAMASNIGVTTTQALGTNIVLI